VPRPLTLRVLPERVEIRNAALHMLILLAFVPSWRRSGERAWRGYRERSFWTDVAYTVFYVGGIYAFLVSGPLYRLLSGLVAARRTALRNLLEQSTAAADG